MALLAVLSLGLGTGCTPAGQDGRPGGAPSTAPGVVGEAGPKGAVSSAAQPTARAPSAGESAAGSPSAAAEGKASATQELLKKLQPPGLPVSEPSGPGVEASSGASPGAPGKPAEAEAPLANQEALLREANAFGESLLATLDSGDPDALRGLLLSDKELEELLQPGVREIMGSGVTEANFQTLERVSSSVKGKKDVSHSLEVGALGRSGAASFKARVPVLSGSMMTLNVNGSAFKLRLDQLVHIGGAWRIFRLSTP